VGYASSRAHNDITSRSGFHNSDGVFKGLAQAARIEGGQFEFARTLTTTPTLTTATPTTRVFITPTGSSKASRRPLGLKVGYASSRARNNNTNTNTNTTNYTCFHNSNGVFKTIVQAARNEGGLCEFALAQQQHQSLGFS
jgi:hypothetical protein